MLATRCKPSLLIILILNNPAWAETLIDKERNGKDLTAVEITAIYRAEIRWCENKSSEFKKQSGELIQKFENHPKYKEISSSQDFNKLRLEADAFVLDRRKGAEIKHTCDRELVSLKNFRF
jgi:hypothetical protein